MPMVSATWKAEAEESLEPKSLRPTWENGESPALQKKNTKLSQARWHMPMVSGTQEVERGGSLEPTSFMLQ